MNVSTPENLAYRPRLPKDYRPKVGLIGCGAITVEHLAAYKAAGIDVVALCDLDVGRALKRQKDFFSSAKVYSQWREITDRDDIEVIDITTHPRERVAIVEGALKARKHVLSQKPFVLNLDDGERLVELAEKQNVKLAVNQNGRWAPHFSYARAAIAAGLLGDVGSAHLSVQWDHTWVKGREFEKIKHLILYDFAIHWFDIVRCFLKEQEARRVYASYAKTKGQTIFPPLLAQALIEFDHAQASLSFDAETYFSPQDRTVIVGSKGTIVSAGADLKSQQVTLTTAEGVYQPKLVGKWFPDGFAGTMGELLCAIEENREPSNSAADNLKSLALCFAAVASSETHTPKYPGEVRTIAGIDRE
jgi:predicted dehydrogenase